MLSGWWLGVMLGLAAPALAAAPVPPTPVAGAAVPLPTPQFRRYGSAEGVPSGPVYAVVQDHHGLMWFGSAAGLIRYDGVDFKVFRHRSHDPDSLPADAAYTLFVDTDNRIWAGGISTGLVAYDQQSGHFRHWTHEQGQPSSLSSNEVWSIAQTVDGGLWVATQAGLDHLRPDRKGFDHLPLDVGGKHAASFGATRTLLATPDGNLWIGTADGLYVRHADGTIRQVPMDPAFRGDAGQSWHIDGGDGEVRVALSGGLLIIGADGVARPLASRQLSSLRVVSSTRDRQGRLWIGTASGVLLDDGDGRLQKIASHPLLPGSLPDNKVWQTMLDREGGLWITFNQASMAYLPPDWRDFTHFTHVPDDPDSLSHMSVLSILLSRDGKLWVGGSSGWLDKLDAVTGEVRHVVRGMRGQVISLAEDTHGRLWIAGPGELHVLEHGKLSAVDLTTSEARRPVLLSADEDGKVYVASWGGGVFTIDPDSRKLTPLPMEQGRDGDARLPDQLTYHAGSLWYASKAGLQRWDVAAEKLRFVTGVPHHEVMIFAFDETGFWLATDLVLEHYRYDGHRASRDEQIDISRAPFTADIRDMRVDRQGQLWIFANPGMWRLDLKTRSFQSFGPSRGLLNTNFQSGAIALAPNGVVFAASQSGVEAFHPEKLLEHSPENPPLPVVLTHVSVRRDGKVQSLPPDDTTVSLGWRDRDLRVDVRVASYIYPEANRYRFQLSGFDTGWVDIDNRGERDFAGLGAGDYTLHVMGAGADSDWGHLAAPLHIHVQAPPWWRWWAWLIYASLLLVLVGLLMLAWRRRLAQRHRIQLAEQQRSLAEQASAAKTQFLATLSHEIRTPMTGVMGMAELLLGTTQTSRQREYTEAMQRSGGLLLKLVNDALDLARIEAGKLELEPAPFDPRQLVEDVAQLEHGLAHAKGIRFMADTGGDLPARVIGDAVRIKQVLLNLANNALKFTERGSVTLGVRRSATGLTFSISDTGPGIPEASQARLFRRFEQDASPQRSAGSGLGLAICRELVGMMGGSIELQSQLGKGSTFRVHLPLRESMPVAARATATPAHAEQALRLLLVEDDAIVAAVVRGLLERQGHAVVHVANGLIALAELDQGGFDAVLLDLDLPGVDGFQVARLIRQREGEGEHVPIIAVTARSGSEDEALAQQAGMDHFLRKPLTGEQLTLALASVTASPPVRKE